MMTFKPTISSDPPGRRHWVLLITSDGQEFTFGMGKSPSEALTKAKREAGRLANALDRMKL